MSVGRSTILRITLVPTFLALSILACSISNVTEPPPSPTPSDTPAPPTNTPIPPTETPVPTNTAIPTEIAVEDPMNDGIDCVTGDPLPGDTPADVDITMVLVNSADGMLQVVIEIGGVDAFPGSLFGGVEFRDPTLPPSNPDASWWFEGKGNTNFSFQVNSGTFVPSVYVFDPAQGGWYGPPGSMYKGMVDGNTITLNIPGNEVPPNSFFYVSVTNFSGCDFVGLDSEGTPFLDVFPYLGAPVSGTPN